MECVGTREKSHCSCTYVGCEKRGNCCKCVEFHRKRNEIPGCFFTETGERTYDRTIAHFLRDQGK